MPAVETSKPSFESEVAFAADAVVDAGGFGARSAVNTTCPAGAKINPVLQPRRPAEHADTAIRPKSAAQRGAQAATTSRLPIHSTNPM